MLNDEDRERASSISVDITLDGDAFHPPMGDLSREVARMLRDAADGVEQENWLRTVDNDVLRRPLRDSNGNTCGVVMFYRAKDEEDA